MSPLTASAFHLTAKTGPTLIAGDEQHFEHTSPGGTGQAALDP